MSYTECKLKYIPIVASLFIILALWSKHCSCYCESNKTCCYQGIDFKIREIKLQLLRDNSLKHEKMCKAFQLNGSQLCNVSNELKMTKELR